MATGENFLDRLERWMKALWKEWGWAAWIIIIFGVAWIIEHIGGLG